MVSRLVYVMFLGKISPEKREDDMPVNGKERGNIVFSQKLREEERMNPIRELSEKYPCPPVNQNETS